LFRVEDEMYKMDFENGHILRTMKVLEEEKFKIEKMTDAERT
jgi:histone deacetylase complex regulatory component SIN3